MAASETTPVLHDSEDQSNYPDRDNASTIGPASDTDSLTTRRNTVRKNNLTRYASFACAILSCLCAGSITAYSLYGHLFQERLRYTQLQVNVVAIAAELAMYLPVPLFGYLCDRIGPAPLAFLSSILFGTGYFLAAFTYDSGAEELGGLVYQRGWPYSTMVIAFICIGMGTTCLYFSAVTTCAKNFGRGKYKGLALACPIAAFGLSGMWQSQVGEKLLYERRPDGVKGDVDVFRYFLFLAITLIIVGFIGTVGHRVVNEEDLIDEAVEELERSGLLEGSAFFQRSTTEHGYGTIERDTDSYRQEVDEAKAREEEEARKKTWLLNEETRRFLKDPTMWLLSSGFFLVTGPGEAFINNLGTIIGTLYPPGYKGIPTTAATHVSIVALTSTLARIFTGTLTDLLAPVSSPHHYRPSSSTSHSVIRRFTVSRVVFLLTFALFLSLGQVLLASGAIQGHGERFWIVSALIGSGYGAVFSLTPIMVTVIWGVENFGTNWGIVAMVPALGATVWGVIYSAMYQWAAGLSDVNGGVKTEDDVLCYGVKCYAGTFWAMAVSVWIACGFWTMAWGAWRKRGIAV